MAVPLHTTPQGRRAIINLLTPRTRRHFTPAQIALMAETDAARDRTSKKPVALREEEVKKAASPELVSWVAENGANAVRETGGCLVITEIMLYADAGTYIYPTMVGPLLFILFGRQNIRDRFVTPPSLR
jgi:pumilio family protein 6